MIIIIIHDVCGYALALFVRMIIIHIGTRVHRCRNNAYIHLSPDSIPTFHVFFLSIDSPSIIKFVIICLEISLHARQGGRGPPLVIIGIITVLNLQRLIIINSKSCAVTIMKDLGELR